MLGAKAEQHVKPFRAIPSGTRYSDASAMR